MTNEQAAMFIIHSKAVRELQELSRVLLGGTYTFNVYNDMFLEIVDTVPIEALRIIICVMKEE